MRLRLSDTEWVLLRGVDTSSSLHRITYLSSVLLFAESQKDSAPALDVATLTFGLRVKGDFASSSDAVSYSMLLGMPEAPVAVDVLSVRASFGFADMAAAPDVCSVRMQLPPADSASATDYVAVAFSLGIKDAVGFNETFFFGGVFNVDVQNIVFPSERLAFDVVDPMDADSASAGDSMVVGMRHAIDTYFGGFAIGDPVFGGRLR